MPKAKKITKAAKAAKAEVTAVAVAKPAKVAPAAPAPKAANGEGIVLKVAFPELDAEGLKTLRRHLRQALRSQGAFKDQPAQFRFHKINSRWIFPTTRDVKAARVIKESVFSE